MDNKNIVELFMEEYLRKAIDLIANKVSELVAVINEIIRQVDEQERTQEMLECLKMIEERSMDQGENE